MNYALFVTIKDCFTETGIHFRMSIVPKKSPQEGFSKCNSLNYALFAEYNLNILGSSFSILIPIIKGFLIISNIT